ncbi:hypothetical protein [Burkholderia ubonensis]|uniref:hypothetical protein n=1 Tax=Burkholderia ubonensis TaxID=101571 RepID=UPI000B0609FE|nr:hypothetical protein [Burkholderia ubonensis]
MDDAEQYEPNPESELSPSTSALMREQATLRERRQPARLFAGPGFSDAALKLTTLSKYLDFDTWTPEAAAMLVSGLQAPIIDGQLCTEIPEKGAMGLDNCFTVSSQDAFHNAKRVLGIWRSQVNPPARIRPHDFVRWCQVRGFDTSWLLSVEEDALRRERDGMKGALGSGVVVIPSAHLISAEMLANHIAFSMVSIPDDERLTLLRKEVVVEDGVSHIEPLTNDDRKLVDSICGKSLAGCSRAEFAEHRTKFDAAENRPSWSLTGEFRASDEMQKAQARWCDVSIAHKQQIVEWFRESGLSLSTADGIATTDAEMGLVRREDVKRYLENYKLPWRDVYGENSDAFRQSAHAPIVGAAQRALTPVPIVAILFVDPVRKHVPVGDIPEMTARAVHPNGGIGWAAALEYHKQELDAAIRRGEIHGFEPATMRPLTCQLTSFPLKGAPLASAWVSVEDVQKFASGVGVKVTFDFSEVKYEFEPEARAVIAGKSEWSETELEALCLGVPPTRYHDDCAPETERNRLRQAILAACKSGKLDAHETGGGNAVYGGKWSIERVSAVRWAITNHFDRFPEWLARSCHAEIWKQQDEERRTAGRCTLQEAADALEQHTGTAAEDWLAKLGQAVSNDHLPVYRPGEQARYRPKIVRPFYEEAYWDDLNAWLKADEPRVKFQFTEPPADEANNPLAAARQSGIPTAVPKSAPTADAVTPSTRNVTSHRLTRRGDLLTPVIQRVVAAVGSYDSKVVFTRLREIAINEEEPLNGVDNNDGGLLWTDANGSKKRLTKKALAERLRTMSTRDRAG